MIWIFLVPSLTALFIFYRVVSTTRFEEPERRFLEQDEFLVAHVLRMIEQPDTTWIFSSPDVGYGDRRFFFLELSKDIRADVWKMIRGRKLSFLAATYAGLFFLSYHLLFLKTLVKCGTQDLRYLAVLSVMIWRATEATT